MKKLLLGVVGILLLLPSVFSQNLQISGGNSFSAAVCDNQRVFVWGANQSGQLGITPADVPVAAAYNSVPTSVLRGNVSNVAGATTYGNLPPIRQIDAGSGAHLLGLSCEKQVWAWGENDNGQLGRNTTADSPIPSRVLRGAQAASVSANDPNGIFLNNITYVSGGNNSSFAIEAGTGRVLAWGANDYGQLGDGTVIDRLTPVYVQRSAAEGGGALTNIVQIEGGDDCAYALDANGHVWSWGITHDGTWPNYALGRAFTGQVAAAGGGGRMCLPTAGRVLRTTYNGTTLSNGNCHNPTILTNIVQISGGDAHALALDANGNVWSWGGDWGEGQLGQGPGFQQKECAGLVVDVGATYADITPAQLPLGSGSDGRAVYIAAGQAVSAVVMANGRVVTFGSRGLFNSGATPIAPSGTITCPGSGDVIRAGSLGDNNNTTCNATDCAGKANAANFSHVPVYVRRADNTILTGIKQVSDGDAWFNAINATGNAFVWGWNRRGELGLGTSGTPDYTDRCAAVPFTLPTGCAFADPCPTQPNLGLDVVTCPIFSQVLNSNVPQTYTSWKYTWEFKANLADPWTPLATLSNNTTYSSANQYGYYRVSLVDNRATVPFLCAPCPVLMDTIIFTPTPSPYTVTGCVDGPASMARFEVVSPAGSQIKWYTNSTGGSALNPLNTDPSIVVPFISTNISVPGCARALFAEDISSIQGTLLPATTTGQIATALGAGGEACASGSWSTDWDNNATPRNYVMIEVTRNTQITAVSALVGSAGTSTFTVRIYNNNPTGGPYCGSCTPAGNKDAPGTLLTSGTTASIAVTTDQIVEIPVTANLTGTTLAPGKYWIAVQASNVQLKYFNCSKATTNGTAPRWTNVYNDNTGQDVMRGVLGMRDNNLGTRGASFNIKFQTGTGYGCSRILVCATATCTLPVELLNFTAKANGSSALLNWTTAKETNSSHFIIMKSNDGLNFSEAGTVKAAGNSSSEISYSFIDDKLGVETTYYRLVQVDLDGTAHYSSTISVGRDGISGVKVVPNPNNGSFDVILVGYGDTKAKFTLINSLGQEVYSSTSNGVSNGINIQHLSSGIYYLRIASENGLLVEKIIKE